MRIDPSSIIQSANGINPSSKVSPQGGFIDLLKNSIQEVNHLQIESERVQEAVLSGEEINPAIVAAAVNKADLAFQTIIQVRNKLVEAFQEIRRLQV